MLGNIDEKGIEELLQVFGESLLKDDVLGLAEYEIDEVIISGSKKIATNFL